MDDPFGFDSLLSSSYPDYTDYTDLTGIGDGPLYSGDIGGVTSTPFISDTSLGVPQTTSTPSNLSGDAAVISSLGTALGSLTTGTANLVRAADASSPSAGYFNAAGQFIPLSGGTTSVVSPNGALLSANNPFSTVGGSSPLGSLGTTLSSTFSSLTPYLPYLIIGAVILVIIKLFKKL